MLSIHNIASASGGASYYMKTAEYYQGDGGREKPEFQGKHIKSLVGMGEFTSETFTRLLNGELPDGKRLGKAEKGQINHRPGVDLTFSAPKSLSILALIDDRPELIKAHNQAVTETINYIQKNLSYTRNNGVVEKVDNVSVIKFLQTMSRAYDPQLHTHCVVMNMVKRGDDNWRSMVTDTLYQNKMMLGQLYRTILAHIVVHDLGYQIDANKGDGTFEITGVPASLNRNFSKRRLQIESIAKDLGITSAAGFQSISTHSRKRSIEISPSDALVDWKHQLDMQQVDLSKVQPQTGYEITQVNKAKIAREAVAASIKKLDTFMRFYSKKEVVFHAMQQSLDKAVCPIEIDKAVTRAIIKNTLIPITKDRKLFISGETYQGEVNLRYTARKSWDMRHLHVGGRIKYAMYRFVINNRVTIEGLALALNSNKLVSIIDNFELSLDHKGLERAIKISKAYGKKVSVVAISMVDRDNLSSNGFRSTGVDRFVKEDVPQNSIVMVYGAEKATFRQMNKIMDCAKERNIKVILFNAKDNASIDTRYSPVDLMAESGVSRVAIRDRAQMGCAGVNILSKATQLVDIENLASLAKHFTSKPSGLIISSNQVKLNEAIRETLLSHGGLGSDAIKINNYTYKHLTDIELNRPVNYAAGDLLKIENISVLGKCKSSNIKEGAHFKVVSTLKQEVTIEHCKLKTSFTIDLDKTQLSFEDLKVFKHRMMELRVGDRVLLPNDNTYGKRFSNVLGTVKGLSDSSVVLDIGKKEPFVLYTKDRDVFLERGWVVSAHRQVKGWAGDIDIHLAPETVKNVLKNLSYHKLAKIGTVYIKDHESVLKSLDHMTEKLSFISSVGKPLVIENDKGEPIKEITLELKQTSQDAAKIAENMVELSLNKIIEKDFDFTRESIIREAAALSVGVVDLNQIENAIDAHLSMGTIVAIDNSLYSSEALIRKKEQAFEAIHATRGPIWTSEQAEGHLKSLDIPDEHKEAVHGLLTSNNSISLVQGYAGTAKTSLTLKNFSEMAKLHGYKVKGYAPTHSARLELRAKAGIEADTVASAMSSIVKGSFAINDKTVVIVDESSMLSIQDMAKFITTCTKSGAKLVFVGDHNQQPSVGAGEIFKEIVNGSGADVHYIKGVLRQKTAEYKEAVQSLAEGDVLSFFNRMKESIIQVKGLDGVASHSEVIASVARSYVEMPESEREQTQIITLTNTARSDINSAVRDRLMGSGSISSVEGKFQTYQSSDYSDSTKHFASSFSIDDILRFNSTDERHAINQGEYLRILSVSDKDNTLLLKREDGTTLSLKPDRSSIMSKGGVEIYREEPRAVSIGEKLIFRRSIEESSVINTDMGTLTALQGTFATIQLKDRTVELDLAKPENRHWDYAYAVTSHAYQGKDCKHLLLHFDTRSQPLANYQSLYVGITRGEHTMKMFTDSIQNAKSLAQHSYDEKNLVQKDVLGIVKSKNGSDFKKTVEPPRRTVRKGYNHPMRYDSETRDDPGTIANEAISKIERAQGIFKSGILVSGTIAEKYLVEHSKIPLEVVNRASSELRYIPEFSFGKDSVNTFQALAFAARNQRGVVQAVQVVLLDRETGQKLEGQAKYSFGVIKGASLNLGKPGADIYIAEGPETALSVFSAKPDADVRAALSVENMKNVYIPLSVRNAVIFAENDGLGATSEKAVTKAVESIKGQGVTVTVVMPEERGQNFNDLMIGGVREVKSQSKLKNDYHGPCIALQRE